MTDESSDGGLEVRGSGRVEDLRENLPGLVRIAAGSWLHTAEWGLVSSLRLGRRVVDVATHPSKAGDLVGDAAKAAGVVGELARSVTRGVPLPKALMDTAVSLGAVVGNGTGDAKTPRYQQVAPTASLRQRGEDLLNRSRDVWNTDVAHPAYERILGELAPDEARILVLLIRSGPQPSVDVRTGGPVGMVSSELIAPGLNMIGPRAGVRYLDRVPAYLNNLFRLGLIWFSSEALRDGLEYQVVEAQPDVLEAMHSVRFARVVRRSIHLTSFGEDFCRICLIDEQTVPEALPAHAPRPDNDGDEAPTP
ncbi:Abi-alpha family protein [Nocardioides limicola]|uniref:Abi-alpha family protein n=1 Tax=Nocardioides limicola TaxID=2803368 RepID=UPI00193B43A1|nr:Abi-alpha family protein [Nocardioides sp. DJM-14]